MGRTYGVKGWLKIHSFTIPAFKLLDYVSCTVFLKGKFYPLHCKAQGNFLIGQIEGQHTPEEAKKFVNAAIVIFETQLPTLGEQEYYWADLIHLDVYNLKPVYLGKVESLFETGANDVLVVKKDKNTLMIPYVMEHVIKSVDLIKKQIVVDWDETWT